MTDLLEEAIAAIKKLPDSQQDKIAKIILKQILPEDKLLFLWQKINELGPDKNELTMTEITVIAKKVRHFS